MNSQRGVAGRPRASSPRTIEDAASELFLEQGFERTTVDEIARRAGVSRATVFNYFPSKSDVLWLDVDEALARLERRLPTTPGDLDAVFAAILDVAAETGVDGVPLAVTQRELIGASDELASSGLVRVARLTAGLRRAICVALAWERHDPLAHILANATAGAIAAAWASWARAGVARRPLEHYVGAALELVRGGADAAIAQRA